jgi:hypothetical protein
MQVVMVSNKLYVKLKRVPDSKHPYYYGFFAGGNTVNSVNKNYKLNHKPAISAFRD